MIVRVPFPYTDRSTRQRRPALVVSASGLGPDAALVWVVMITSAENRGWPGDVEFGATYSNAGLPAPSIIRTAKIAAVEMRQVEPIGRADRAIMKQVEREIEAALGRV